MWRVTASDSGDEEVTSDNDGGVVTVVISNSNNAWNEVKDGD
jgi:hypothetical protein